MYDYNPFEVLTHDMAMSRSYNALILLVVLHTGSLLSKRHCGRVFCWPQTRMPSAI